MISGLGVAEAVFRALDPDARGRAARARRASGASRRRRVLRVDGLGAGAADRRAHRAELPRPAVRRRDARPRGRARGRGGRRRRARSSTRARPRRACARSRRRAVAAGGGINHRAGLYDFDPHQGEPRRAGRRRGRGGARAPARRGPTCRSRSRCATPAEIDEALAAGAPRLLLDNMTPRAGARRGRAGRRPRGARGLRRRDARDSCCLRDHKGARLRLDGRPDPLRPRPRPVPAPGGSPHDPAPSSTTSPPCRTRCARSPASAAP